MNYEPWVGAMFPSGLRQQRLLIIGHSHYRGENEPVKSANRSSLTEEAIKDHIETGRFSFFKHIENVITAPDGSLDAAERSDFWNKVAFSNYLQEALTQH